MASLFLEQSDVESQLSSDEQKTKSAPDFPEKEAAPPNRDNQKTQDTLALDL